MQYITIQPARAQLKNGSDQENSLRRDSLTMADKARTRNHLNLDIFGRTRERAAINRTIDKQVPMLAHTFQAGHSLNKSLKIEAPIIKPKIHST